MKTVLKTFALFGALIAFSLINQSCNKLIPAQDVNWSGIDDTLTMPIVNDTLVHGKMGTGSFTYDLDSMIKAKTGGSFSAANIGKVTLNSCTLTILNPDNANNFANFELCDVYFNSNKNPVTAHTATIPNNPDVYAESLSVPVDQSIDLKSYVYSSSISGPTIFSYLYGGKLRRVTTKPLHVKIHIEYKIHVQP